MKKLFVAFIMLSFLASCQHEEKDLSFKSQVAELTQALLSDGYDPNPSVLLSYDEEQRYTKWKEYKINKFAINAAVSTTYKDTILCIVATKGDEKMSIMVRNNGEIITPIKRIECGCENVEKRVSTIVKIFYDNYF